MAVERCSRSNAESEQGKGSTSHVPEGRDNAKVVEHCSHAVIARRGLSEVKRHSHDGRTEDQSKG